MTALLLAGLTLGLSAGFSPGPLLALVISHSLRYGFRAGIAAACAPLVTDAPIVLLSVLVSGALSESRHALGAISLAGSAFLVYLAIDCVKSETPSDAAGDGNTRSLMNASLVNLLSPHPYLFWFTVGGPRLAAGWRQGALYALCFIGAFYACLVGSKVIVAAAASRSRGMGFFSGKAYAYAMRVLGAALFAFAFLLTVEGVRHLVWRG